MKTSTIRKSVSFLAWASLIVGGAALAQGARRVAVTEVVIATSVEDHEPVGAGTSFTRGTPLFCFIRAQNRTGAEATIKVSWEAATSTPPARSSGGTSLAVPARPTFRTYARSAADRAPGNYRCVVRADDGTVLGNAEFAISG